MTEDSIATGPRREEAGQSEKKEVKFIYQQAPRVSVSSRGSSNYDYADDGRKLIKLAERDDNCGTLCCVCLPSCMLGHQDDVEEEEKEEDEKEKQNAWRRRTRWIAVLGAFLVQFTLGSYYSFANIMPYMVSLLRFHQRQMNNLDHHSSSNGTQDGDLTSYGDFIQVQSAWGLTQGCVLPLAGYLISIIGNPAAVIIGSLLFSMSTIITAWTLETGKLWTVILSYGVLSSIGQNVAILPTLTIPMASFPEKKGLVSGVVVSGFGAGSFVFNQIQTMLANPNNALADSQGYFDSSPEVVSRVPRLMHFTGLLYAGLLALGSLCLLLPSPPPAAADARAGNSNFCRVKKAPEAAKPAAIGFERAGLRRVLKRPEFYWLWLGRFGMVLVSQGQAGFYKAFGLDALGLSDNFLSMVGSVAGIFNCVGRLTFGVLVDVVSYRTLMGLQAMAVTLLLATFYPVSAFNPMTFATAFWASTFCLHGVFAMHPAVCSRIFADKSADAEDADADSAADDTVALGLIGSGDIVNNLLIGLFSQPILDSVGWPGYFTVLSACGLLVLFSTLMLPKSKRPRRNNSSGKKLPTMAEFI